MTDYGIVEFSTRPEPLKTDEYSVYICTDIKPFDREIDGEISESWTAHMVQYDKDEYLKMQIAENAELAKQITDTQLALCELYENMEV